MVTRSTIREIHRGMETKKRRPNACAFLIEMAPSSCACSPRSSLLLEPSDPITTTRNSILLPRQTFSFLVISTLVTPSIIGFVTYSEDSLAV